jgi:hypothetical protein
MRRLEARGGPAGRYEKGMTMRSSNTHLLRPVEGSCLAARTASRRAIGPILVVVLARGAAACAGQRVEERIQLPEIAKFSARTPGMSLPAGWQPWQFAGLKKPTEYRLVEADGRTVLQALSQSSASGFVHPVKVDLREYPYLHWQWMVPALIEGADNSRRHAEDAPVRVIVAFEGDVEKLPLADRLFFGQFKLFTKTELPYATLMYIWENRQPVGTVLTSEHTSRIKMVVAESGPTSTGEWQALVRNVREDYLRAFGEEPPPVKSIAVMTDSDNTGRSATAFYGDIAFTRTPD